MKSMIQAKLEQIEREQECRILLAVESGSRAWGFDSLDSDYDVRFIYVRPKDRYLQLQPSRDVIENQMDYILDINGWDLDKALRLMYRSNPTLCEWLQSTIIYRNSPQAERMRAAQRYYCSPKSSVYHYLNMAKANYKSCLYGERVKAKKYLYVLRPLLAAKWILQNKTPPPMRFEELAASQLAPELNPVVQYLLEQKRNRFETGVVSRIDTLNSYLDACILELEKTADAMPSESAKDWETLNELYLSALEV